LRWGWGVALTSALTLALSATAASAQPPAPGTPYVLDGPSAAIPSSGSDLGMSIARDGTGGLAYLKSVGGTMHVFVSQLSNGQFRTPVQIDSGLSGGSSQPVIAAGDDGILLVGFVNSGELYVVDGNAAGQFASPIGLATGAGNPAISMSNFGKAYLAFTVADGSGHDVRAAYYYNGQWALEPSPLNASPADDAGLGGGRASVAAAGDGIAIVAWGEQGHIYSRRVWGTSASVVYEQADAAPSGCTESSVSNPVVGAGGDSSYAAVAFAAVLDCGGQQESRVLMNRLQGSVYDGISAVDGQPGSPDGADDPQIAVGEYGGGWITSARTASDNLFAASLGGDSAFSGTITQVNSVQGSQPLDAVAATAGLNANVIAWQQEPGSGAGDIRIRYAGNGVSLGPETVISSPAQGPTNAADGLAVAGDVSGDVAVAWMQGAPNGMQLVVNQLYQPPTGFSPTNTFAYATSPQPVLSWPRPDGWGPITYTVSVDGNQVGQTTSTYFQVPAALADGPHTWRVTATNPAGQHSSTPLITVFVDTVAPEARLRQLVRAFAGSKVRFAARYADHAPAGEAWFDASGVGTVLIRWGDGSSTRLRVGSHFVSHRYRHRGRYKVTLLVYDRAGNLTRVVKYVKVFPPQHKHRASPHATHSGGGHP
jgi:hypothetical protein